MDPLGIYTVIRDWWEIVVALAAGAGMVGVWWRQRARFDAAKAAAERERAWLHNVVARSLNEVYVFDPQTLRFIFVNTGACRNLGYTADELACLTPLDLKPALNPESFAALLQPLRSGERELLVLETVHRRKDASEYPVEVHLQLVDTGGELVFLAIINDITDRKRVRDELHENTARLRLAISAANVGLYDWDLRSNQVQYSPEWKGQIGYAGHEISNTVEEWLTRVHPEDLARCVQTIQAYLSDPWPGLQQQFRFRHKDGSYRWVMSQASLLRDEHGRPARMLGSHVDITDMKRAEEQLREREIDLKEAQRLAQVGSWAWTLETDTVSWSEELYRIAGRDPATPGVGYAELAQFFSPATWAKTAAAVEAALQTGAPRELDLEMLRPDGAKKWITVRGETLHDSSGQVVRLRGTVQDITVRKQVEAALRESERRLRDMMENVQLLTLMLDERGHVLFCNEYLLRLTGWLQAEVLGRDYFDIFIPPDAREDLRQLYYSSLRQGALMSHYLNEIITRSGERRLISWNNTSLNDAAGRFIGVACIAEDITERKQAETALRESQARLAGIVDSAMDGIVTIDEQERILVFNAAAEAMFGCPAAEAIGQPMERFMPERFHGAQHGHLQRFAQMGESPRAANQFVRISGLRSDGREFPIEASMSRTRVEGHLLFTIILRDITEQVRGEAARRQLEAQLRFAQRMEALGTLAGGIAHDFNNILSAIIGNTELARQDVRPGHPAISSLDEIRKASHRAKDLVQRILGFSSEQAQPRRVMPLHPAVEEAVTLLRATLPSGVDIVTRFDTATPAVLADPTQIHQILMNLCTNAWHALEGAAGRIDICLDGVTLGGDAAPTLRPGHFACLSVTDTGKGMDAATVERIFDPFFTTKPIGQGTGLGLSVVHGIMKAHDGAITVSSRPGEGTTFRLYFPATAARESTAAPVLTGVAPRAVADRQHVLYLDDEEALVSVVTRALERFGYRVSGYAQPAAALAAVRADPTQFDVVVTDLNMPGTSGLEVAREVSRLRPDLPVILASGYITEELRVLAPEAGVRQLIYKPNMVEELCAVVPRLAGEPKQA